jgi:hypothetical protein
MREYLPEIFSPLVVKYDVVIIFCFCFQKVRFFVFLSRSPLAVVKNVLKKT